MQFIDTHNHLGCADFNSDRNQVIENCLKLGVTRQILVSAFSHEWLKDIQLANSQSCLYVACGIHPIYIPPNQSLKDTFSLLKKIFEQNSASKLCALGEIGLDYYIEHHDKDLQQQVFKQQLELAAAHQRPVLLHVRRAHADTIKILKALQFKYGGIAHAFSGSYEEAKEYIRLGFKIGLGGAGTYPQAHRMHRVLQQLPLESIVLETDAPDLSPITQQGKRNSPELLPEICQLLADIKKVSVELLAQQTTKNACELFNWPLELV